MTYLCVPIFVATPQQVKRDVARAIEAGAEMIELRLDTWNPTGRPHFSPPELIEDLRTFGIPLIATCRSNAEGGQWNYGPAAQLELLQACAKAGAQYIDLELANCPHEGLPAAWGRMKLILSSHDFQGRPDRLNNLFLDMDHVGCDVQKVAWTARSVRDNIEAFEILQRAFHPTIALCMGEAGIISRILAKKFKAFLTFAALDEDSSTAPGQITISAMKQLYRWDKIKPKTKVYGVVAHPVGHSMSPAVHNAAFEAIGYDGVYVPFLVQPAYESFKAFMESFVPFEAMHLSGLSVTLPHKENALRYLQEKSAKIEELAVRIGAVNTILIDRASGTPVLSGMNTDYVAILQSLKTALRCDSDKLAGIRVGVIGAGGTGRTAVAVLSQCKADVVVYNRTPSKAESLAQEFGVHSAPWDSLGGGDCQVYINTTSVGMHPNVNDTPFGTPRPPVGPNQVVFDTIYNPMETKLLKQAKHAGATTVGGIEMFLKQAIEQFQAWTGETAPADVMRKTIEFRLRRPKPD